MTVLLFVTMIIIFLSADYVIQKRSKRAQVPHTTQRAADPMRVPSGIFFAPSHTWLTLFPSGNVRIGVDDFVLRSMTNPQLELIKRAGTSVRKGEPLLRVREDKRSITALSPIDADVVELNESLPSHPDALKKALFSDGWAYTVRPKKVSDLTKMLLGDDTNAWIQNEFERLREFVAGTQHDGSAVPVLMQDGGAVTNGFLDNLSDETVRQFEQKFLTVA